MESNNLELKITNENDYEKKDQSLITNLEMSQNN